MDGRGASDLGLQNPGLLAGCKDGDVRAWERLVRRYERLVFSIPLSYGVSRDDAAEVAQNTFTILMQSLDSIREETKLAAWLATVARRQTWILSAAEQRERVAAREAEMADTGEGADPIDHWERLADVLDALERLGGECQELLEALYFDPFEPTYADVAARLGRPEGSIGPTRARCLAKLRSLYDPVA